MVALCSCPTEYREGRIVRAYLDVACETHGNHDPDPAKVIADLRAEIEALKLQLRERHDER